ncbi:MAG: hypothetical protein HPY73_02775 [Methanomassiliicoccales archaeon]|nr:MAG: hypothetical protein HPY73_02775 [Methanomassiliicoccales archaeon]
MSNNRWFYELKQNGMLISPSVLEDELPKGPAPVDQQKYEKLRDAYAKFRTWFEQEERPDPTPLRIWINALFESFLEYGSSTWQKDASVSDRFKLKTSELQLELRPDRVLFFQSESNPRLMLKIDRTSRAVGMGRARSEYSKFVELLRGTGVKLGIITNGMQVRLVYAAMDSDSWVEWDVARWFENIEGREQLAGFQALCGPEFNTKGNEHRLLQAVLDSRSKQGELSQVLGENTRLAVEELLSSLDRSMRLYPEMRDILLKDPVSHSTISEEEELEALYQASIRLVMRIVVVLFAESRDLLPRNIESYHASYGVEGLYALLKKAETTLGLNSLETAQYSWPRLLSLFRLIHEGSSDVNLNIIPYGGALFRRGDKKSSDPVLRALALFEDQRNEVSDATVLKVLNWLKKGEVRIKVGRSTRKVSGLVDFSDLRTEYIGMMYEGLLDYRLRRVKEEEKAVIFLNIGEQPALPLSLLESLDDSSLKNMIKELGKVETKKLDDEDEEGSEGPEDEACSNEEPELEAISSEEEGPSLSCNDVVPDALLWAMRAVEKAGIVKRPRGKNPDMIRYEEERRKAAARLIVKEVKAGETYLVRGSGTRKGTGTFYTKPQLAVPTVIRTLEPLLNDVKEVEGRKVLVPKTPEEILSVKVCDPAMGSGSFLVAALNYITDCLYSSLWEHNRFRSLPEDQTAVVLPFGERSKGLLPEDIIPCRTDDEAFEMKVKARLKRYVVERCIYGVDINHLAVELAKLSLWVETMDRGLPFGFLDHKLKCGNSLVGCWADRFQEYPLLAWKREGGDAKHDGVHHKKKVWTEEIKDIYSKKVKPELESILLGQHTLDDWEYGDDGVPRALMADLGKRIADLHDLPLFGDGFERREQAYRSAFEDNKEFQDLRSRFDLWCAVWFWPGDWMDEPPTPKAFYSPSESMMKRARALAQKFGVLPLGAGVPRRVRQRGRRLRRRSGKPAMGGIQAHIKGILLSI